MAHLDSFPDSSNIVSYIEFAEDFLLSLSALLFLVTGKSANNNKCQFPIYLRNQLGWQGIPAVKSRNGVQDISVDLIPRVLDSESWMTRIARIHVQARQPNRHTSLDKVAQKLLFPYVNFLLSDAPSRDQLTAYLHHFQKARLSNADPMVLLAPLVMFQVRGSVAASGGHEPEEILREKMISWGMIRNIDFNSNDVILDAEAGAVFEQRGDLPEDKQGKTKTRAYDFVLPFRTPGWHPRILIQSQFYAGDSGSVSHKNVDQTSSSRLNATKLFTKAWPENPMPVFLEYVDGAGYSASLNGDLKSLLSFADTAGFFQIRTASIRLRRELQKIGFLTPLEIGHAILRCTGEYQQVANQLIGESYRQCEIDRAIAAAMELALIGRVGKKLVIAPIFLPVVRCHLLLDIIATAGVTFPGLAGLAGLALVPGYGPYHGMLLADIDTLLRASYKSIWKNGFMHDLQQLCNAGLVVLR